MQIMALIALKTSIHIIYGTSVQHQYIPYTHNLKVLQLQPTIVKRKNSKLNQHLYKKKKTFIWTSQSLNLS